VLGTRPRARIPMEASTDSEWVARRLEALGHEVIVADPNFAPMYATRSRKVKTDRRDARALAEAPSPPPPSSPRSTVPSASATRISLRLTSAIPALLAGRVPLACGGADAPSNLQWLSKDAWVAKSRVERRGCTR
jgi:transposase